MRFPLVSRALISFLAALALACGGSTSTSEPSVTPASEPATTATVSNPEPTEPVAECTRSEDCTIIVPPRGATRAAPVDGTDPSLIGSSPGPGPLVTPSCSDEHRCELREELLPEFVRCQASSECTLIDMAWGSWYPVRVGSEDALRAELLAEVEELGAPLLGELPPRPGVACLAGACVPRRPR